jgi:hypothetical protein
MDADIGWVLDFSLSEQEPCAMLVYFNPRDWWLPKFYFWTRPWNSNLLRLRTLLLGGSLMSAFLSRFIFFSVIAGYFAFIF